MPPKAADLSGLVFRKLTTDDATALQWVEAVTFEDTFLLTSEPQDNDGFIAEAFRLETIEEELSTEKMLHFGLIDEHSGEMAAFLKVNLYGVQTEDGPEIPRNSLEVQRLYVMPRFKRRGLGTYLMEKAVDIAQEHGCTSLWLGVWQYNFAAQQFYKSWGYERFSEHTFMVGEDPQVDFLLQKKL
ncbi:GNAT family N-acetyltransferase [Alloscardovia criceti]|uniref:GNAT family N-acetyltransferase n=1 Tax=Alloscardovia criceti TaxID=356828 RepID=UPI000525E1DE|nr:GNAT family N-acetyltransferase [Alloscardovia criceti]